MAFDLPVAYTVGHSLASPVSLSPGTLCSTLFLRAALSGSPWDSESLGGGGSLSLEGQHLCWIPPLHTLRLDVVAHVVPKMSQAGFEPARLFTGTVTPSGTGLHAITDCLYFSDPPARLPFRH